MAGLPSPALMAGYDWAGLEPIEMRGMDYAAVDPLTDFGGYTRVIVDPVEVVLDEDWSAFRPGSTLDPTERDLERLRQQVAEVVREGFMKEIREGDRYQLVDDAVPGALRLHARVVDVRLNAPDLQGVARTEQFARSAGEWTLVADLVDVQSGAVVARLVDRWTDPEESYMRRMTRVENTRALQRATEAWARAVRRHLDVAGIRNRMEGAGEGLRSTGGG
jgi:hypothetical protein